MSPHRISRRHFLRGTGLGAAGLLCSSLGALGASPERLPQAAAMARTPRLAPYVPDAEVSLTAVQKTVSILPGTPTVVYGYEGKLVSGSGVTVQAVPGSYLGPILRVKSGTKMRITLQNRLPERTVLHPHGLRVPEDCDGQPMQAVDPGQTKVYDFPVIDRAGPYWFHPHPMGRTAEQVVLGLAGLFYVWDQDEVTAVPGASTGANDIPVVIQDRLFDANNQFLYQPNMMWGYLGNRVLINGKPDAALTLEPRGYRLRFLNGSNARTYKLGWSNGMPLQVIGTDGGLLPAAVSKPYVMLMPGERVDVWADLASLAGQQLTLRSLAFDPGGMGMMGGMGGGMGRGMGGMGMMGGGMMGGAGLPNGTALDLVKVTVGREAKDHPVLGPLPALGTRYDASNVSNFNSPYPVTLAMGHMMTWTLNGRIYNMADMREVAADEKFYRDQNLAWEWVNNSPIPHPMHIHNVQFQVVQRNTASVAGSYSTVNEGLLDTGWKDTVLVWPGERVKVAMRFGPNTGMYMYHCHILEHEDMTMMRNFMILDQAGPGM